jgi:hypothetical protein
VIAEAYRHLVDPTDGLTGEQVGPRALLTCEVDIEEVLDLRSEETLGALGLTTDDLRRYDYTKCQKVGATAHQIGLGGVLAPAATELGETLAVFERNLKTTDRVTLIADEIWPHLPADPRPTELPIGALLARRTRHPNRSSSTESEASDDAD